MKKGWIAGAVVLAVLCLACVGFGIWKVNSKVNALSETVGQIQNAEAQRENAQDKNSIIPTLTPGTDGWMITQFGDPAGQQEMCYTITTENGLVIIDGGYSYETPRLREIISEYGNSVEAWILTHYHPDHMTAFLDIYEDPQGITIHHVYAPERAELELMQEKAPWDDFSMLDRFDSLEIPELEYLHKGDEVDLLGLKMNVLSAYNKEMESMTKDLMNDGSLLFTVSGGEESMLFCADVGVSLSDSLVEEYGDKLKADYVQMGHHGFGGLGEEFYRLTAPRAAFFDAPDWLVHGEGDRSTREKEALMRGLGCTIFSYYTAPNQILLK